MVPMIEVQNLSKSFNNRFVVDDMSFSIRQGEIVGFLGPNGAGKTTTIRMLTGYLPPSKGTAKIAGHDIIKQSSKAQREIGYMPESVPLYEDMRVAEYLKFRAQIKGLKGSFLKERMVDTIEQCGLQDVRRYLIRHLSKGYRQRVGLADALIHEPKILILDEPTNGLDPNQIRSIRTLIKDLSQQRTVIVCTHILTEVEATCNKVIIIDNGKIKANDTPEQLINTLRSTGIVILETQGKIEEAPEKLKALQHIKKVRDLGLKNGWNEYEIVVDAGTDARERIANLCVSEKWPFRSLHRAVASLEDVFVELTRKD